jgi:hypothetical protein
LVQVEWAALAEDLLQLQMEPQPELLDLLVAHLAHQEADPSAVLELKMA